MFSLPAIVVALAALQGQAAPAAAAPAASAQAPVSLGRVFTANEQLNYSVRSHLQAEVRGGVLTTWIPQDLDINYDFSILVQQLKTDGIAVLRYKRPTMTQIEGEDFDSGAKTHVEKTNIDYQLTLSPFNEILDQKDLAPKKKTPEKKSGGDSLVMYAGGKPQVSVQQFVGQFIGELYRLCLFTGPMDSALDFAPRSTFDNVKVGDTWKRTVGYQPQKLKGKNNEQAVQRLDYVYTYKGMTKGEKGDVMRVEANLEFSTDLADFVKQITGADSDQIGLEKVPMKLSAVILFDLDPKTKHTLKADAKSQASVQFFEPGKSDPALEERMKGQTSMWLANRTIVKPAPATNPTAKPGKGTTTKGVVTKTKH